MAVAAYLRRADEAWIGYDGNALASLLSFQDNHVRNPKLQVNISTQIVVPWLSVLFSINTN